ncbi:response regulator [Aliarcobacter cryaerophilus]|uniref:response regulator transcription factor n=1 Tax=Aliarcobacter cryaerophilus TaxID=28198 RepID=UPI000826C374|nr:response regulator [Aliarcobacter cryaerophilus]AYJ77622.1 two-component system response regulator [Aliarcobacter cryaerophilus D2610]MCT7486587.1 response regulator [Aliarcobacter cryaerophilus]MCT7490854.1 response regulator [Aliarcobacter cryaerophilus]MCT7502058.1 response regulator [Aliarcobacter cryaerophilus]MCT7509843.1 response regulator [Aliarcobacter cryaerophilus]
MFKNLTILKSLTVLYAEDDLVIQDSISRILKMFFKDVVIANDGKEAIENYNNKKIDILILDYVMPNLNGYETAKIVRKKDKKIPILITSAYTDKEKLLNAIELNLIKYIEKPILYDDLIKVFENIIKYMEENNLLQIKLDENIYYSFVDKNIIKNGEKITLTKNEVLFLELLLEKPNHLISKNIIENSVFKASVDENTLRNMVYRLRKKIDTDTIATIKDLGYIIKIK